MSARLWILGAADPEMAAIESLLRECGECVAYALDDRGERVHPASAYRGAAVRYAVDCGEAGQSETWYLVECSVPVPDTATVVRIDHHRPGDPGFGRSRRDFLAASAIGQVVAALAQRGVLPESWEETATTSDCATDAAPDGTIVPGPWRVAVHHVTDLDLANQLRGTPELQQWWATIPRELVLTAAADHCLGAAYRGECPGVDPDELMRWRAESRARFQGRPVAEVLADVERAQQALSEAQHALLVRYDENPTTGEPASSESVRDMRTCPVCDGRGGAVGAAESDGYDPCGPCHTGPRGPIPELPEAATRLGVGYISGPLETPDGRRKITVSGTAEQVRAFLEVWAPSQGLVDAYGDPARGFGGAYLPEVSP